MQSKHFIPITFSLLLFLFSCWEMTADIMVTKKGQTRLKITHRTILCSLVDGIYDDMRRDGFKNIKSWYHGDMCGISGEKWGTAKDNLEFANLLNVHVEGGRKTGFFTNHYKFQTYIGHYDEGIARERGLGEMILKSIRLNFRITLPGRVVNTNGKLSADGRTANFYYSLYSLGLGKQKIFIESEEGRYKDLLSAKSKAEWVIEAREQELYEIQAKLSEIDYKISWEKRFKEKKDSLYYDTDRSITNLMNEYVDYYKKNNGTYPGSDSDLKQFLQQKGIASNSYPLPLTGTLVYESEKHLYRLVKP